MDLVPQSRFLEVPVCSPWMLGRELPTRLGIKTHYHDHDLALFPLILPRPSPFCSSTHEPFLPASTAPANEIPWTRSIRVERPKMAGAVACGGRERGRKCRFPVFPSPLSYSLAGYWRGLEPLARWGKRNVSLTWSGQRPGIISFAVRQE